MRLKIGAGVAIEFAIRSSTAIGGDGFAGIRSWLEGFAGKIYTVKVAFVDITNTSGEEDSRLESGMANASNFPTDNVRKISIVRMVNIARRDLKRLENVLKRRRRENIASTTANASLAAVGTLGLERLMADGVLDFANNAEINI